MRRRMNGVTFGKNLLDLKRIRKGADIATALYGLTIQTTHGYQSAFHSWSNAKGKASRPSPLFYFSNELV